MPRHCVDNMYFVVDTRAMLIDAKRSCTDVISVSHLFIISQDSDEDAIDNASDTSSTTGGRDSVLPDHDASSVCSNSSNNDDAASNRSCSPSGSRIEVPGPPPLPGNFKRVISDQEGRSCVRTDVIFVQPEKPKKEPTSTRETSSSKNSPSKAEVS